MTQEKIVDKLRKIKAMAEGAKEIGNEAEAEAFAATMQRLLHEHKLSLSDLDYQKEMEEEPIIEHAPKVCWVRDPKTGKAKKVYEEEPEVEVSSKRTLWVTLLANIVAKAYSCQIVGMLRTSNVIFVGHKSNVAICEYTFLTLLRAAHKISWKAYGERWKELTQIPGKPVWKCRGFRQSFLDGFTNRIDERLKEEFHNLEGNSTLALVRINKEALAVRSYMDKFTTKANFTMPRGSGNADGYDRGRQAANGLDLKGRAMNEGKSVVRKELQ